MSFNLAIRYGENELCDKCRKPSTELNPLVDMWTSGRHADQRNFIQIHISCLVKKIHKEQAVIAEASKQALAQSKETQAAE